MISSRGISLLLLYLLSYLSSISKSDIGLRVLDPTLSKYIDLLPSCLLATIATMKRCSELKITIDQPFVISHHVMILLEQLLNISSVSVSLLSLLYCIITSIPLLLD